MPVLLGGVGSLIVIGRKVQSGAGIGAALLACSIFGSCTTNPPTTVVPASPTEAEADYGFSLDVSVSVGMRPKAGVWTAEVHVPEAGDATVRFMYWNPQLPAFDPGVKPYRIGSKTEAEEREIQRKFEEKTLHLEQRLHLDAEDRRVLRETIERSGFFGEWPVTEEWTDLDSWAVTVRRGESVKSRDIYAQPEFQESEKLLWRLIHQAVGEWALTAGRQDILDDLLRDGAFYDVLHRERFPKIAPRGE